MTRLPIPPEMQREYQRARQLGGLITVIVPLLGAVSAVLSLDIGRLQLSRGEQSLIWFGYALIAFSVTICLIARIVHQRLMEHVLSLLKRQVYRGGKVLTAYLVLHTLYLCPTLWGFVYLLMGGSLPVAAALAAITVLAGLLLTPPLELFFRDR